MKTHPKPLWACYGVIAALVLCATDPAAAEHGHITLDRDHMLQRAKHIIETMRPEFANETLNFMELTYRHYADAIDDVTVMYEAPARRIFEHSTELHDVFNYTYLSVQFYPSRPDEEASVSVKSGITRKLRGIQGLRWSIQNADLDELQRLLNGGADIDTRDERGETPLFWAVSSGKSDIAVYLIEQGADASLTNVRGTTPLMYAAREGLVTVVAVLLDKGADINARDINATTALHLASSRGRKDVAELLLATGAEVNATNRIGQTALHRAVWVLKTSDDPLNKPDTMKTDLDLVKLLLEHGADPGIRNSEGHTPKDIALQHGAEDVAEFLTMSERNREPEPSAYP